MNLPLSHAAFQDALQANFEFAVKELTYLEPQLYAVKYPDLDYASMIPVDTSAGEWVKTVTYRSIDGVGRAEWINGSASDVPVVGIAMDQLETTVHMAAIGMDWGLEEINQARMLGISLDAEKGRMARRAYEQLCYDVAFTGDTVKGFQGLFSYTGVPAANVAADGTGSSTLWANKTGDQISRDINALLIGLHTATKTTELADTLILPIERFMTISSQRLGDSDMTVMEYIQKTNVYTAMTGQRLDIRGRRGMLTIGAGSTARMIAYRRSPEVLKMHIPMPHRFLPVQTSGLRFVVPGIFRLGGLDVRLPKAISYGDGI